MKSPEFLLTGWLQNGGEKSRTVSKVYKTLEDARAAALTDFGCADKGGLKIAKVVWAADLEPQVFEEYVND